MKKITLGLASAILLASCGSGDNRTYQEQPTIVVTQSPQVQEVPGFDIPSFSNLLRSTSDPVAIQGIINSPESGINNLDLDGDGQIDYLKVDQTGPSQLQVVDELPNERVTIATLDINTNNRSYSVMGDPNFSGGNYAYHSPTGLSFGEFAFLSYMLQPRRVYYHPTWGYRSGYASNYRPYSSPTRAYTREQRTTTTTRTVSKNNSSANSSNNATNTSRSTVAPPPPKQSIVDGTKSQRSFEVDKKNDGKPIQNAFTKSQNSPNYKAPATSGYNSSAKTTTPTYGSNKTNYGQSSTPKSYGGSTTTSTPKSYNTGSSSYGSNKTSYGGSSTQRTSPSGSSSYGGNKSSYSSGSSSKSYSSGSSSKSYGSGSSSRSSGSSSYGGNKSSYGQKK